MKAPRFPLIGILIASLAVPGCSIARFTPALATVTPVATATVEPGGSITFEGGPTVGSVEEAESALDGGAPALEIFASERYDSSELSQAGETYTYTITLDTRQIAIWQTNWCATTEEILKQNLEHTQVEFLVNGEAVSPDNIGAFETRGGDLYCAHFVAVGYDWPEGQIVLEINVTFDELINDGMADYSKGTHIYRYDVTAKESFAPTLNPPGNEPTG